MSETKPEQLGSQFKAQCISMAIINLEEMGYTFTKDGEKIRYTYSGDKLDERETRILLRTLKNHKDEAVIYLRARQKRYGLRIRWLADAQIGVIQVGWQRLEDGRIEAVYTPDELATVLAMVGSNFTAEEIITELGAHMVELPPLPDRYHRQNNR